MVGGRTRNKGIQGQEILIFTLYFRSGSLLLRVFDLTWVWSRLRVFKFNQNIYKQLSNSYFAFFHQKVIRLIKKHLNPKRFSYLFTI